MTSPARSATHPSVARPEVPLQGLRFRLTAWYVGTFAATLIALGLVLFVVIRRQVVTKLDASLNSAAEVVEQTMVAHTSERDAINAVRGIRIPGRTLYLLDASGRVLFPDSANRWVRDAATRALLAGHGATDANVGGERTLRVHARRFDFPAHGTLIAAAAADVETLESEYAQVIGMLAVTLGAALVVVGFGGYALARKSSLPVEQAFDRMRRFMADAAHELRTPVAVLRATLGVSLQQPRDAEDDKATIREASAEAERLSAIVDNLFTLARAEAGQQLPNLGHVALDDIALESIERANALATMRHVRLEIGALDQCAVHGDPALLEQLAMILLDNAIKYTPPGGSAAIAVSRLSNDACALSVTDTGIGIDPAALPHVFDRFYRAEHAHENADGAGLGLSIARWIAEVHQAEISIASDPGQWTTVRVVFPRLRR